MHLRIKEIEVDTQDGEETCTNASYHADENMRINQWGEELTARKNETKDDCDTSILSSWRSLGNDMYDWFQKYTTGLPPVKVILKSCESWLLVGYALGA